MCINKEKFHESIELIGKVKVVKSVESVADDYRKLNYLKKQIEDKMEELKTNLIENKVNVFFEDEKVIYQEGREKTYLDNNIIIKEIGQKTFNTLATITETALKDIVDKEIIEEAKVYTKEYNKASIKVSALSKDDLRKLNG